MQKCHCYYTLSDQSIPLVTVTSVVSLLTEQLWMYTWFHVQLDQNILKGLYCRPRLSFLCMVVLYRYMFLCNIIFSDRAVMVFVCFVDRWRVRIMFYCKVDRINEWSSWITYRAGWRPFIYYVMFYKVKST